MARSRRYPAAEGVTEGLVTTSGVVEETVPKAIVRPPHGSAQLRPSLPTGRNTPLELRDPDVLAGAAKYAYLHEGDQGISMELGIDESLFGGLECEVAVQDGVVRATFRVGSDPNLRRLLEAEKGRLRAALEARGMRKVDVVIES